MRKLVLAAASLAAAVTTACSTLPPPATRRVVVLGIDGLDPDLARAWMREGRLPNLTALAARGAFYRLETIETPECDAAWTSLAAGRVAPKPTVAYQPPQLLLNLLPLGGEPWSVVNPTEPFWITAGRAGVRTSTLAVPGTFPPQHVPNGELLAGSPLPDVRHTEGSYHFFASQLPATEEGKTKRGGILRRLAFTQRVARTTLDGPLHPVSREQLVIPLEVTWNHDTRSANIAIGTYSVHLREREWSRWLELDFNINALARVRGITQLFLISAGTELQLYASPVHWHPDTPPAPISAPRAFASELYDRLGLFRTNGWNAATAALTDERIDEAAFLDDIDRAFQDRAETILNRFDMGDWDVLFAVVESADRVQHVMWRLIDTGHPRYDAELARRYGASIEQAYRQTDELLGAIMSRLASSPETLLLVVSDHGFQALRTTSKWSADHLSTADGELDGLVVSSRPFRVATPRLIDIAPTILNQVAVPTPATYAGKPLL